MHVSSGYALYGFQVTRNGLVLCRKHVFEMKFLALRVPQLSIVITKGIVQRGTFGLEIDVSTSGSVQDIAEQIRHFGVF